jgi:ATP-dependent DNA helicase RecG
MIMDTPLGEIFRLNDSQKKALARKNLKTAEDLLYYFPSRYSDQGKTLAIKDLSQGMSATIFGKILSSKIGKGFRKKIPMGEAMVGDGTGKIKALWFHQPYMAKKAKVGDKVKVSGKVSSGTRGLYMANPEMEPVGELEEGGLFGEAGGESPLQPVYPETRGLSSRWFYHAIGRILKNETIKNIEDYIPEEIIKKYKLPTLKTGLFWIHSPRSEEDYLAARKRFAFEEVFFIQLERKHDRHEYGKKLSYPIKASEKENSLFVSKFSFKPTDAQKKAARQILEDLAKNHPMSRLLEGDVGSGKTFVAALAAFATVINRPGTQDFGNLQAAYMAPTEILANQHFESFISYFRHLPINIGLITSSGCKKFPSKVNMAGWTDISRAQLLKWTANGEIPILIGTHSLIQKSVKFKNLALVIVDEQHRFGVAQRMKLAKKQGFAPHFLSMTATPIPRTLALTIYGDLDLSLLDEMPAGRKQVITEIITPEERGKAYEKIRSELIAGRQAYVICPRIDEPDPSKELAVQAKAATAEAKKLKKEVFPEYEIGVLHSKMSKDKKEKTMKEFADGKISILCATSVVEVGVNVPNATIILIEGAERFGLAQLHQLRGRVLRSSHQAHCYIFSESKSEKTVERLKAIKTAKNGFELAELDLAIRGPGELSGEKQWGISDLGMEAIKNLKMVEAARTEAEAIIARDPELSKYPHLKQMIRSRTEEFHFE